MEKRAGETKVLKRGMLGEGIAALEREGDCDPLTKYVVLLHFHQNEKYCFSIIGIIYLKMGFFGTKSLLYTISQSLILKTE